MKGLEALECSLKLYKMVESAGNDNGFNLNVAWEYHKTIEQALLELKAIKEAKPSEALKYVNGKIADLEDDLQHYTMVEKDKCKEFFIREYLKQFTTIKQALLKAQEQEKKLKALEIVDKKRVNVHKFKWCVFKKYYVNYYNLHFCDEEDQFLNEQEFDLLKEVFCNDISNRS